MRSNLLNASQDASMVVAVVVTHNRPEELKMVVAALLAQTVKVSKILVVDNASSIPASEVIDDYPGVEVVRSEFNTGSSGGFAFAVETALKSKCDWIWMMDDDAVPRKDALLELMRGAKVLPEHAGALCCAVYEFGELARMHRRKFNFRTGLETSVSKNHYEQEFSPIDMGSFVGFMIRAAAVRAVGLPNASFFIAYDDSEYSLRIIKAGWSIWLISNSCIDHLRTVQSKLSTSEFGLKHFYNIRNRLVVVRQYADWRLISGLIAIIYGSLIWLGSRKPLSFSAINKFCSAIRDGWRGKLGRMD